MNSIIKHQIWQDQYGPFEDSIPNLMKKLKYKQNRLENKPTANKLTEKIIKT